MIIKDLKYLNFIISKMHTYISWVESLLELINTTCSFYGSIIYTIIQNIAFINNRIFFLKIKKKGIIFHYS